MIPWTVFPDVVTPTSRLTYELPVKVQELEVSMVREIKRAVRRWLMAPVRELLLDKDNETALN